MYTDKSQNYKMSVYVYDLTLTLLHNTIEVDFMDHNAQLSKMDPKLKEAYERVMGTPGAQMQSSPPPQGLSAQPNTPPVPPPAQPSSPSMEEIPRMVVPERRSTQTVHFGGGVPIQSTHVQALPVLTAATQRKKSGISPLVIILGAGVFFVVYTAFWIKILAIPIPFLSP